MYILAIMCELDFKTYIQLYSEETELAGLSVTNSTNIFMSSLYKKLGFLKIYRHELAYMKKEYLQGMSRWQP